MDANETRDASIIEQDVERTQDAIGDTIEKIEDRLSPGGIAQSLLGDNNANAARDAWLVVRESPVPVALIVAGSAWLLATSKAPMVSKLRNELKSRLSGAFAGSQSSAHASSSAASARPPSAVGEVFDRRPS